MIPYLLYYMIFDASKVVCKLVVRGCPEHFQRSFQSQPDNATLFTPHQILMGFQVKPNVMGFPIRTCGENTRSSVLTPSSSQEHPLGSLMRI